MGSLEAFGSFQKKIHHMMIRRTIEWIALMTCMVMGRASTDMENMNGDYLISSTPKGVATKFPTQYVIQMHT